MKHRDHHHSTVAEARACEFGTQPKVVDLPITRSGTSIVMDRLRRANGQKTFSTATTTQQPEALRPAWSQTPDVATPGARKYAEDRLRLRAWEGRLDPEGKRTAEALLADQPVSREACSWLINELGACPYRMQPAETEPATPASPQVPGTEVDPVLERRVLWSVWRELAAELVATSSHPSGARFAIANESGPNDLSFWWVSEHKGSRGPFYKLRQVIGGGRREDITDPRRMIDIARRIKTAGPHEAMIRFGQELGTCGHCGRELTNKESRDAGIGPICRTK